MLSTALELAGFAAVVVATYLLGGPIPATYVLGAVLLFLGVATDESRPARTPGLVVRAVKRGDGSWGFERKAKPSSATIGEPLTNADVDDQAQD